MNPFHDSFLKPHFDAIPGDLKALSWAVWIAAPVPGRQGKFNKAPRCPNTGALRGANDPSKFGTFQEARSAYESGGYTGVGVILDGTGIVGIDIDNATEALKYDTAILKWLKNAVEAGAYCECSPSNTGLRLFMVGALPDNRGRKVGPLEIYSDKRFLTVTGRILKLGVNRNAD
jgi:primase-polymerase (primpol)-like protein